MNNPMMTLTGASPLKYYKGTFAQNQTIALNGDAPFGAPELTEKEKAIVLYHYPDAVFPNTNFDNFPPLDPCPIAVAILINQVEDALSKPRNYQEYPIYATKTQVVEIRKWLDAYDANPDSIHSTSKEFLMKPYEEDAKPMDEDEKCFMIAKNIIGTYASGSHKYSLRLRNVIAKTGDKWVIQKLAKFLFYYSHGPKPAPLDETADETADEMAERWANGGVTESELCELDRQDQSDVLQETMRGPSAALENNERRAKGLDALAEDESGDKSNDNFNAGSSVSQPEDNNPVAEEVTVTSSEEPFGADKQSSSKVMAGSENAEAGPTATQLEHANRVILKLSCHPEPQGRQFVEVAIKEESTKEEFRVVLKRSRSATDSMSHNEDPSNEGTTLANRQLKKHRANTWAGDDSAPLYDVSPPTPAQGSFCTESTQEEIFTPTEASEWEFLRNNFPEGSVLGSARDDDELSSTKYPFPEFDNSFFEMETEMIVQNIMHTLISNRVEGYDVEKSPYMFNGPDSLSAPSSPSPSASSETSTPSTEEIINFQPLDKKPNFKYEPSALASKLPAFLDEMKRANENLNAESAAGFELGDSEDDDESDDDSSSDDQKEHIEMNLGLGVLEEQELDEDDTPYIKQEPIE